MSPGFKTYALSQAGCDKRKVILEDNGYEYTVFSRECGWVIHTKIFPYTTTTFIDLGGKISTRFKKGPTMLMARRKKLTFGWETHYAIFFFVILVTSLSTGCVFVRGEAGEPFNDEDVAFIHKGQSTRDQVAILLGAPDEILDAGGYEIFHFRRFDSKMGYLFFLSRLNISSDNLYVFFNSDGIVAEVIYGKRTPNLEFQVWPFGES